VETRGIARRKVLLPKSDVMIHQCSDRVVCPSIAELSTAGSLTTTFIFVLNTCLSSDGKALLRDNVCVVSWQRFSLLLRNAAILGYPPLSGGTVSGINNGGMPCRGVLLDADLIVHTKKRANFQ